ncbi:hypothetical protein LAZ67_17001795 [Cordylochernes scorpioides]|uniref:Uncharacterized protein n=1 Tax=Cordylochernes scorpioides TaxID=51811 RepID=A0ABY6LDL7_9ARAC|nr:hypothetical protein LAZ67_17001795 [Cordylochernes scorpioides]
MSSGTAVPTTRGPMGRLSIIPGHQGGEGFAESGRRGELRSLRRINSGLGFLRHPTELRHCKQRSLLLRDTEHLAALDMSVKEEGSIDPD